MFTMGENGEINSRTVEEGSWRFFEAEDIELLIFLPL